MSATEFKPTPGKGPATQESSAQAPTDFALDTQSSPTLAPSKASILFLNRVRVECERVEDSRLYVVKERKNSEQRSSSVIDRRQHEPLLEPAHKAQIAPPRRAFMFYPCPTAPLAKAKIGAWEESKARADSVASMDVDG
ncbi:MAG: hypothetical protein EBX40_01775 [Gammaproteobacteria bacterium]|nr:hypothetical protein [Gammaproteobacteria bacterium]